MFRPKDEQLKLEAECAKHDRNLKILENKLKSHEENIQAMKNELAQREEELQVTKTQLTLFNRLHLAVTFSTGIRRLFVYVYALCFGLNYLFPRCVLFRSASS